MNHCNLLGVLEHGLNVFRILFIQKMTEMPYQVQQANIAIANGGIFLVVVPVTACKEIICRRLITILFIAIIIEEYGLLGGAFIIFIYLVFLFRCIRIFRRCPMHLVPFSRWDSVLHW